MDQMRKPEESIVRINSGRIRPPGHRRQMVLAVTVMLLILGASLGAFFLLKGKKETYILRDFEKAAVRLGTFSESIQASGTVSLVRQVDLPNQTEGYADRLFVAEGDTVTPATVLAALEVPSLQEDLEDYQLQLEEARLTLERLTAENRYEIRSLTQSAARLEKTRDEAQEDADTREELVKVNASRSTEWEEALDTLESAEESLEDARMELEKQQELNLLSLKTQEAVIRQLETRIQRTLNEIEEARLKSPIGGEVLYINPALSVPGGYIAQDTTLFTVGDRSSAVIGMEVYEQYAALLSPGQQLVLTIGSEKRKGEILSIGQFAETSSDGLGASVTVTVRPDQSEGYLTPGATAVSDLSLGDRENVMLLPRGAWLTTGSQKYVYILKGDTAEKTRVTLGEIGDSTVEILSGVQPGDRVITSGYQNFIEYTVLSVKEEEND